jgi:holo-ACP synthase/triphosphoribosyl-dephospho-CoA synthase
LNSILEAREQRVIFKKFLAGKGLASLSFSLNIPGYPKSNSTAKSFFGRCLTELRCHLKSHLIEIISKDAIEICDAAGDFFLVPLAGGILSLHDIKQICEDFEVKHPLGRFLDVDLNDELGDTVSSGKSKLCFYCKARPAIDCRRSNAHDPELLRSYMFGEMANYCRLRKESQIAKGLSAFALKAILLEISLTPKPGLVDKFSNGSHSDMDYQTFINSSAAISVWFEELVRAGLHFEEDDLTKALPVIRNIGLQMEAAMYEATSNINTQKGIIFLMGLSLVSCGKLYSQNDKFETETFRGIVRDICKDIVRNELVLSSQSEISHGEEIFQKYGFSGARGEAESGFKMVFEFGFPQLNEFSELNDESLIKCFLAIASGNTDTNILYRRGPKVLSEFQEICKIALEKFNEKNYSNVIEYCLRESISPGGSADLLAISIFIWSIIRAEHENKHLIYR